MLSDANPFAEIARPILDRPGTPIIHEPTVAKARRANVIKKEKRFDDIANPGGLTGMEYACLRPLLDGGTAAEVAGNLAMSIKTHQTHMTRARTKMKAGSTLQAALLLDRWEREVRKESVA